MTEMVETVVYLVGGPFDGLGVMPTTGAVWQCFDVWLKANQPPQRHYYSLDTGQYVGESAPWHNHNEQQ